MSRARAYERKRRRSRRVLEAEGRASLRGFFTGGVELDDHVDPGLLGTFFADALRFLNAWEVPPGWGEGVELKLRRLGQHKAEGLFYPEPPIIVLDQRCPSSFAHELGHLLDYTCSRALGGAEASMGPSSAEAFGPFLEAMRRRMGAAAPTDARFSGRKGRVSWAYFASAPECFARAFEQCTADLLEEPCVLVRPCERYRSDPLFFEAVPGGLADFFRGVLSREIGPALPARAAGACAASVPGDGSRAPLAGTAPRAPC